MVTGKLVRAIYAALSLCLMASCGFFTASTFPASATQTAGPEGLSAAIPASFSHDFTLSTVTTASGIDLVFLACNKPYDGPHLIVMDKDLNVLQNLSYQELGTLLADFSSTSAILGTADDVAILGLHSTPTAAGLVNLAQIATSPPPGPFSFSNASYNYAAFSVFGDNLDFTQFTSTWGFVNPYSGFDISPDTTLSFQLISLSADSTYAIFIMEEDTKNQEYFITIPRALFPAPAFPFARLVFLFHYEQSGPGAGWLLTERVHPFPESEQRAGRLIHPPRHGRQYPPVLPALH